MLTFIKANGVYMAFWLVLFVCGLVGVFFAVKWGVIAALTALDK